MVIFEAARAICSLKDVTSRELSPAVTVLQLFLSSSKPVLRFAAVRMLNKVGTYVLFLWMGMWELFRFSPRTFSNADRYMQTLLIGSQP